MGWSAIIAAILQVVGPLIAEWLRKWLDGLLERTASEMGEVPASAPTAALLEAAYDRVPRLAFARRSLLRVMMRHANAIEARALDAGTAEDIRAAGLAAAES